MSEMRFEIVRGAVSTTMPFGSELAYEVVIVSPATPGLGSNGVPSTLTVTVWKYCVVAVGNGWSAEPSVLWPGTALLFVPATSRSPNAKCGLSGGCPASACSICVRINSRSLVLKVTATAPLPIEAFFWIARGKYQEPGGLTSGAKDIRRIRAQVPGRRSETD